MSSDFPAVLILAGGLGTRLGSVSEKQPKAMVNVAGAPFISHQLRLLQRENVKNVVLSVSHMAEQIEAFVGDGSQFGLKAVYSHDGATKLGTGGAIKKALPLLSEDFAVLYGDTYLDINFAPIYAEFQKSGKLGLATVLLNQNKWDRSNMLLRDGIIKEYNKTSPAPEMEHIDYGLTLFKKKTVSDFPGQEPFDMGALFQHLIAIDQLAGYEVTQRFYEIGTPSSLAETERYLLQNTK